MQADGRYLTRNPTEYIGFHRSLHANECVSDERIPRNRQETTGKT